MGLLQIEWVKIDLKYQTALYLWKGGLSGESAFYT
jgi:hypothetical protein